MFWHRKVYAVGKPEPIDAKTARPSFPALFRLIFRTFGRQEEFVQVKSSGPEQRHQGSSKLLMNRG